MKGKIHNYPQKATEVSHTVTEIFRILENLNIDEIGALDSYLDACKLAKNTSEIKNPYQYQRRVNGQSSDDIKIRHWEYERAYNQVVQDMMTMKPIEFMLQYMARTKYKVNESGINNGILFDRFFGTSYGLCQKGGNHKIHKIIIDPPSEFVEKCCEQKADTEFCLTLLFTNRLYADVYRMDECLSGCRVLYLSDQVDTWEGYIPSELRNLPTHILEFCYEDTPEKYGRILKNIRNFFYGRRDVLICLCTPTAYFDHRRELNGFRKCILNEFSLLQIVLIDQAATRISPSKRGIFVLSVDRGQKHDVSIEKTKLIKVGRGQGLKCIAKHLIPHDWLDSGIKTLNALFADGVQKMDLRKRNLPILYPFSKEIWLWISGWDIKENITRPKYNFHAVPSSAQKQKNKLARGRNLVSIQGAKCRSKAEVDSQALRILLSNPNLKSIILEEISRCYEIETWTLKTFWFLYRDRLIEIASNGYDDEFCVENLCNNDFCENDLGNVPVNQVSLDVVRSVMEKCKYTCVGFAEQKFNKQLCAILDLAFQKKIIANNPIRNMLEDLHHKNRIKHEARSAMFDCVFSRDQETDLIMQVDQGSANGAYELGLLMRYFTGMSMSEICALNIGDYSKVVNQELYVVSVNKKVAGKKDDVVYLDGKWKYRVVPVVRFLQDRLNKWCRKTRDRLRQEGVSDNAINESPLLGCEGDGMTRMKPKDLKKFCDQHLNRLSMHDTNLFWVDCNRLKKTDVSNHKGDILNFNFKIKAIECAQLESDELACLVGNTPRSVLHLCYIDHTNGFYLLKIREKLDAWVNTILLNETKRQEERIHNEESNPK